MLPLSVYESVFHSLPMGGCLLSPSSDAVILDVNERFLQAASRSREDLVGNSIFAAFPSNPDDLQDTGAADLRRSIARVLATGQADSSPVQRYPIMVTGADGQARYEERFWHAVNTPILDQEGGIVCIMHATLDLTRQVQTDAALRESERRAQASAVLAETERWRLDAVLEAAPVGIAMADAEGSFLLANAANLQIWGKHPASITPTDSRKGWWADGSERHGQALQAHEWPLTRALHGEEAPHATIEIEPFDAPGARRHIFTRAAPIRDPKGQVIGSVVANMDITAQVKTEAALRESEAKFHIMTDAMPQLVWAALPDGSNVYCNQQWYDFTGAPEGTLAGDAWGRLVHRKDQLRLWERWQECLQSGEPFEMEHRFRHRSGQFRWMLARCLPVRDQDGAITQWMGTLTDIHDHKLAQEELKLSNQRKDEFLAMLAHELRNPLAPISTAAQILKIAGADAARVRQASDIITRQVKHMTELVNDLLDVSRVTRGLVVLDKEIIDVKSLVGNAIEQARPLIEARRHVLHTTMSAENALVLGDRTRLIQVLVNLLLNAAKYTPQAGEIILGVEVQGDEVKVSVSDNGNGIEPNLLPHIFDLFTQGKRTPDRSQGGLGLGLALVKSIMALHDGKVAATSDGPGKGSTFSLIFPLLSLAGSKPEQTPPQSDERKSAASARLMIVDDNQDAAQTLAVLLEAEGHEVVVREDASSALNGFPARPPQMFILDIGLPDLDGYELARRLRARPDTAGAVFVALTGYGQMHDKALAAAAGFDHHFVKPVDTDALRAVIARVDEGKSDLDGDGKAPD